MWKHFYIDIKLWSLGTVNEQMKYKMISYFSYK